MAADVLAQENAVMDDVRGTAAPAVPIEDARVLLRRLERQAAIIEALADDVRLQRRLRHEADAQLRKAYDYTSETIARFNEVLAENRRLRNEPPEPVPDDDDL